MIRLLGDRAKAEGAAWWRRTSLEERRDPNLERELGAHLERELGACLES